MQDVTAINTDVAATMESIDMALADLDLENDEVVEELDAALEDLEAIAEEEAVVEEPEVVEEQEVEAAAEESTLTAAAIDDDLLADLDLELARTEAYNAQESAPIASEEEQEAIKAKGAARAKKASSGSSTPRAATPRTPRDINAVPAEVFVLNGDVAAMDDAAKDAAKAATMALLPKQVKVAEKFENLLMSLAAGKLPSRYTVVAYKALAARKTLTSADLVGAYKAEGLKEGTARSQSGQMMNLFSTLQIADRSGQTLTLREDSNLAARLNALLS